MKKISYFLLLVLLVGCGNSDVEKPKNLIEEQKMVSIIYDLALLEAIKTQKPLTLHKYSIDATNYIYKKYDIDSLQFAKSNKYYASDLERYKKMYQQVSNKLEAERKLIDSLNRKNGEMPQTISADDPIVR